MRKSTLNSNDTFITALRDAANTPSVDSIEVNGIYFDPQRKADRAFSAQFTPMQIMSGSVVLPEGFNGGFAMTGLLLVSGSLKEAVPKMLDEFRQRNGVAQMPFRWICRSIDANGRYVVAPGPSRD